MSSHKLDQAAKYNLNYDYIGQIHSYNIDIEMNHIYLTGEETYSTGVGVDDSHEPGVEFIMATRFIKNLNICMRKNPQKPILIHMKTNGGYWEEGMAIYDAIKACPNPVTILNYTHARSMSSLIFQAANKRVMMKHSKYMYHEGTWAFEGTMRQARTEIIEANSTNRQMLDVYIEVMKRDGKMKKWSKKKIEQYLMEQMLQKEEVYLNAKETVTCGLADVIFGEEGSYNWAELVEYTDEQLRR